MEKFVGSGVLGVLEVTTKGLPLKTMFKVFMSPIQDQKLNFNFDNLNNFEKFLEKSVLGS